MDSYYSKNTTPANATKAFTTRHADPRNFADESSGFCICPKCFHLIYDERLTGVCPCCHYQFCPPLPENKTSVITD